MRRKEEIEQAALEAFFPFTQEARDIWIEGAEWADAHPRKGLVDIDKDIREMTLGEIEDLILKQYNKVKEAHYWLFDKKNNVLDMLLNLNECVLNLRKNQKFITDDEFIDNLIKDFQKDMTDEILKF